MCRTGRSRANESERKPYYGYEEDDEAGSENADGACSRAGRNQGHDVRGYGWRRHGQGCCDGDMAISSITIDPEAVDPEDVEMLQDMVTAAVNEALRGVST